jgi:hypothetical protein
MDLFNNFVSFHASLANKWEVNKPFTDFKEAYNLSEGRFYTVFSSSLEFS